MLVTACIKLLRKKRLGVTAIKRAFHELKIDWTGSDSDKFSQAGAENVMVLGNDKCVIFTQDYDRTNGPSIEDLLRLFPQTDIFLLEGFVPEGSISQLIKDSQEIKNSKPTKDSEQIKENHIISERKDHKVRNGHHDDHNNHYDHNDLKVMCAGEAVKMEELKYPIQEMDILITESDELAKEALSAGKFTFSVHAPEQFIKHLEEHHGISS